MKAVILDDQPIFIREISEKIYSNFHNSSIYVVDSLDKALSVINEKTPDIAIVDASTPGAMANVGLRHMIDYMDPRPVLVMDVRHDRTNLDRAWASGAKGYVVKTSTPELIEAAIALVAAGGIYFPHRIEAGRSRMGGEGEPLSKRQMEVLEGLMKGMSNREIAQDLGITLPTVKLHVHAILAATGARNRTEAAMLARDGLLSSTRLRTFPTKNDPTSE